MEDYLRSQFPALSEEDVKKNDTGLLTICKMKLDDK